MISKIFVTVWDLMSYTDHPEVTPWTVGWPRIFDFGQHCHTHYTFMRIYHGNFLYCQTSNISHTLEGNKHVDHSDVVGASPVGAAPNTSSFLTWHLASMDWAKTSARWDEKYFSFVIWCAWYSRCDSTCLSCIFAVVTSSRGLNYRVHSCSLVFCITTSCRCIGAIKM